MTSHEEIINATTMIQDMSKDNINQILAILRIKFVDNQDINFAIRVLPILIIKINIFRTMNIINSKIILEIDELINCITPAIENYFNNNSHEIEQQKGFIAFCKALSS